MWFARVPRAFFYLSATADFNVKKKYHNEQMKLRGRVATVEIANRNFVEILISLVKLRIATSIFEKSRRGFQRKPSTRAWCPQYISSVLCLYRLCDKVLSLHLTTTCKLREGSQQNFQRLQLVGVIKYDKLYKLTLAGALLGMQLAVRAILLITVSREFQPIPSSLPFSLSLSLSLRFYSITSADKFR